MKRRKINISPPLRIIKERRRAGSISKQFDFCLPRDTISFKFRYPIETIGSMLLPGFWILVV